MQVKFCFTALRYVYNLYTYEYLFDLRVAILTDFIYFLVCIYIHIFLNGCVWQEEKVIPNLKVRIILIEGIMIQTERLRKIKVCFQQWLGVQDNVYLHD